MSPDSIISFLSIVVGLSLGICIAYYEIRLIRGLINPRMKMARECKRLLQRELAISTHADVKWFGGDIVLTCRKANRQEIEPRLSEIKRVLAEFPDAIALEGSAKHPEIILMEPPRAGKRDEKPRPVIVLQPTFE